MLQYDGSLGQRFAMATNFTQILNREMLHVVSGSTAKDTIISCSPVLDMDLKESQLIFLALGYLFTYNEQKGDKKKMEKRLDLNEIHSYDVRICHSCQWSLSAGPVWSMQRVVEVRAAT